MSRSPRHSRRRRWRGRLALLGCLAVVGLLTWTLPSTSATIPDRPVPMGSWAADHDRRVRATKVWRATSAASDNAQLTAAPGRVLVVVAIEVQAQSTPVVIPDLVLVNGTIQTMARDEFSGGAPGLVQPGFTIRTTVVFEVAADDLASVQLAVPLEQGLLEWPALELRVDLDLAVTQVGQLQVPDQEIVVSR